MATFTLDPALILAGGATLPITLLDGKQSTAFVKLLRAGDDYRTFILLADDFDGLAEFITGSPAGWSQTVHPDSVMDLAEKAIELNFSLARRWAGLRAKLHAIAGGSVPPSPSTPSTPNSPPMPA